MFPPNLFGSLLSLPRCCTTLIPWFVVEWWQNWCRSDTSSTLWLHAAIASLSDLTPTRKLKLHIQMSNSACCHVIYTQIALPCNTGVWCLQKQWLTQYPWMLKLCNRVRWKYKYLPTSFQLLDDSNWSADLQKMKSWKCNTPHFIVNIIIQDCCFLFPAALMGLLGVLDLLFVNHACHSIITRGASVQLVFGFEVCQISLEAYKCITSLFLPPGGDGHRQRCCYHIVLSFSFLQFPENINSFKQTLIWLKKWTLTVWYHVSLMLVKVMGSKFFFGFDSMTVWKEK